MSIYHFWTENTCKFSRFTHFASNACCFCPRILGTSRRLNDKLQNACLVLAYPQVCKHTNKHLQMLHEQLLYVNIYFAKSECSKKPRCKPIRQTQLPWDPPFAKSCSLGKGSTSIGNAWGPKWWGFCISLFLVKIWYNNYWLKQLSLGKFTNRNFFNDVTEFTPKAKQCLFHDLWESFCYTAGSKCSSSVVVENALFLFMSVLFQILRFTSTMPEASLRWRWKSSQVESTSNAHWIHSYHCTYDRCGTAWTSVVESNQELLGIHVDFSFLGVKLSNLNPMRNFTKSTSGKSLQETLLSGNLNKHLGKRKTHHFDPSF